MPNLEIIRTPDFQYSGFYFPEIVARLRRAIRAYAPEITNEDMHEPFIQLERAFALVGHYNNVLLDMMANEVFLTTARLPESIKYHLANIDYRTLPSSPATVEVLGTMGRTYTNDSVRLLEANRQFATTRNSSEPEIVFENITALDLTLKTDRIGYAYGMVYASTGTCQTMSLYPDLIERTAGYQFVTADLNKVIEITGSVLANNFEDARITELLDETAPGSGQWNRVRLAGASFVSETGLVFTMRAPTANGAANLFAAAGFDPFVVNPVVGDKFYVGHPDIMWDRIDAVIASMGLGVEARWEFYDGTETSIQPDTVTVDPTPGVLRFELSSLLGIESCAGAHVRVMHVPSGYESNDLVVFGGGINYVDISGYLGQTSPSTVESDYLVFCKWRPLDITEDTTLNGSDTLAVNGHVIYNLPQSTSDEWQEYSIYDIAGAVLTTGYYIRYRVVDTVGAAGPALTSMNFVLGDQYVLFNVTQGKTVEDAPLGSSDGTADQTFTLTQTPYVMNSVRVDVDEGAGFVQWTEVDSFLSSYSFSRHYVANVQTDGSCIIEFGDGTNGRIPPIGVNNIEAIYRIGADENGNIGANVLTVNRNGVATLRAITNPRAGEFWVEADWASVESMELAKVRGPYTLRTMYRAMTGTDCEILATSYTNTAGTRPVARARAYEEAFGPKTVEIVVAGQGGAALNADARTELEGYFNGNDTYNGILALNHEATITNYTPRQIGVVMEVIANAIVTEAMVLQTLSFLLSATSVENDGVTYVWRFGQEIPLSRIISEIFKISPGNVFKVTITSPTIDIGLSAKELPVFDPTTTSVVIIPPNF